MADRNKSDGRTIFTANRGVGDESVSAEVRIFALVGESDEEQRARAHALLDVMLDAAVCALPVDTIPRRYNLHQEVTRG